MTPQLTLCAGSYQLSTFLPNLQRKEGSAARAWGREAVAQRGRGSPDAAEGAGRRWDSGAAPALEQRQARRQSPAAPSPG